MERDITAAEREDIRRDVIAVLNAYYDDSPDDPPVPADYESDATMDPEDDCLYDIGLDDSSADVRWEDAWFHLTEKWLDWADDHSVDEASVLDAIDETEVDWR